MKWGFSFCQHNFFFVSVLFNACRGESTGDAALQNGWIDPDTVATTKISQRDGRRMELVASDEFRISARKFESGLDPMFEAMTKPDDTNDSLQFYNGSTEYVTTKDGYLIITTKAVKTNYTIYNDRSNPYFAKQHGDSIVITKNYTSGMVTSWNKFCFTGGILEVSLQLPGDEQSSGLWPALWLMGNLGRVNYPESTLNMWPWSYDRCGEIPQLELKQEINACGDYQKKYNMKPFVGRGSPEIDILEAMSVHKMPGINHTLPAFMSNSLHIAPGLTQNSPRDGIKNRWVGSNDNADLWYKGLKVGKNSTMNHNYWGNPSGRPGNQSTTYIEDSVSVDTKLPWSAFHGQHLYKIEWQPGPQGYLYWYFDEELIFGIEDGSLRNKTGGMIPVEPMYLILNVALSHNWGMPEPCPVETCSACWICFDCSNPECQCSLPEGLQGCKSLPAEMKVDFIRLYQDKSDPLHTLGCSPLDYPTKDFIEAHAHRYEDWKPYKPASTSKHHPSRTEEIEEEIDETALFALRIALAAVIIGMMSATIGVLLSIIWKGIGEDVMNWWSSRRNTSYQRIPNLSAATASIE